MNHLQDKSVSGPHADGTYTIKGEPLGWNLPDGDWTLRDTGDGWDASHPHDSFEGALWATAEDAAHAVLGDPATARKWGDR